MRSRMNLRARFLSTPSGWRATAPRRMLISLTADFYPRPPGGGRLSFSSHSSHGVSISIHALRVEGDRFALVKIFVFIISIHALRVEGDSPIPCFQGRQKRFLSTPSGWRATKAFLIDSVEEYGISIHALRVEGDHQHSTRIRPRCNFYPRPPGGGRQQKRTKFSSVFAKKGEEFASLRRGKRKICRWRFKKDKFWVLIWCEGSRKSVCALASHCG